MRRLGLAGFIFVLAVCLSGCSSGAREPDEAVEIYVASLKECDFAKLKSVMLKDQIENAQSFFDRGLTEAEIGFSKKIFKDLEWSGHHEIEPKGGGVMLVSGVRCVMEDGFWKVDLTSVQFGWKGLLTSAKGEACEGEEGRIILYDREYWIEDGKIFLREGGLVYKETDE